MSATTHALAAILSARRPGMAETLCAESRVRGSAPFDPVGFEVTYAAVGRRLGTTAVGSDANVADASGRAWSIAAWGIDEVARALLLVEAIAHVTPTERVAWIDACYRAGALRERQAVLRALALLPEPASFLAIARDACRASTQPVFEAIACENPYPAAYFPEASFNQMVLKAVFTAVPLARILGLGTRLTPELARMASDYASERAAAGRNVPTDLALLTDR